MTPISPLLGRPCGPQGRGVFFVVFATRCDSEADFVDIVLPGGSVFVDFAPQLQARALFFVVLVPMCRTRGHPRENDSDFPAARSLIWSSRQKRFL